MTSSKRSIQRQRELEISKLKRDEAKLRIARQRLESGKQKQLSELEFW